MAATRVRRVFMTSVPFTARIEDLGARGHMQLGADDERLVGRDYMRRTVLTVFATARRPERACTRAGS